ncbi:hypothetical protein [Paraburkholderia rhizosphaerae]|uniref:Glycosyl transferase family 2 n=1 Tax=Paraburkholderia rhizosphaerae TaxID=480658 RepID=A0A4R8LKY9_9BURK|nr:hypothetical protein [Paraburkholderia rhizosphaerae]TDY43319.1 hypothetical protein BX592_118114 [Paraburkholderia rhizosphaerae]
MKDQFAVATFCHEHKGNRDLMLQSLAWLATNGYKVVVADGGSTPQFLREIESMGHRLLRTSDGLRSQKEMSLLGASEAADHVFYCEVDKYEFFTTRLEETLRRYRELPFDYAVIAREQSEFESFPMVQREIEAAESNIIGYELGLAGDYVYGPAIIPSSHVRTLRDSMFYGQTCNGWGVTWYLLARALTDGLTIGTIATGCVVQRQDRGEFNPGHRLYQANHILGCFYEGLGKPYDWIKEK